ncbi:MAG TPA: hypothetical protein P5572_10990, partial [Phycisphaerae bacterium]|nr:hypothetical protein [Phycisphaerae bacterium]
QETSVQRAERAMRQLRDDMVDFNELRVSSPAEVSASIQQHVPHPVQRAKVLISVLNAIYRKQYAVSLDGLANRGVREVKGYLDGLEGMTPYVSAYLLLWSLGGHAIPVNNVALDVLRREELVDSGADTGEVQAFLERHVSAADAQEFARDLEAFAGSAPRASTRTAAGGPRKSAKATKTTKAAAGRKPKAATRRKTTKKTAAKSGSRSATTGGARKTRTKTTTRRKN